MKKFFQGNKEYFITGAIVLVVVLVAMTVYHFVIEDKVASIKEKKASSSSDEAIALEPAKNSAVAA